MVLIERPVKNATRIEYIRIKFKEKNNLTSLSFGGVSIKLTAQFYESFFFFLHKIIISLLETI